MSETIIKVENLGKRYFIQKSSNERYVSLRDVISRKIALIIPRMVRFLKNHRFLDKQEEFWALDDVNFEIERGEIVGIIGNNGAGKSTLLKILSRITEPTIGRFFLKGRVASLLEVGTGFHPELTGKENIYLNGAILGMSRREIKDKFDEIVEFSEIENFLNTPVKRYSSGMYVRLAFSIAAHLQPEILLVDEILAVGDTAFQNKCLGKMGNVTKEGRTIIFISHNMGAISSLCNKTILINKGKIKAFGETSRVINQYLSNQNGEDSFTENSWFRVNHKVIADQTVKEFKIIGIHLSNPANSNSWIATGDPLLIRINYTSSQKFLSPAFVVILSDLFGQEILRLSTMPISGYRIVSLYPKGSIELYTKSLPLVAGRYILDIGFVRERIEWITKLDHVVEFEIQARDVYGSGFLLDRKRGFLTTEHNWVHKRDE